MQIFFDALLALTIISNRAESRVEWQLTPNDAGVDLLAHLEAELDRFSGELGVC